jgi:hypothetical protein
VGGIRAQRRAALGTRAAVDFNFLISVLTQRRAQGSKPDEAFFVKCDSTTMTQDDIDKRRLICVMGPLRSSRPSS